MIGNLRNTAFSRWLGLALALEAAGYAAANPAGMTVKSGSATTQSTGSQLTVSTGPLTVLNWTSFNIQKGETTTFVQPSANSLVFNAIGDASPSQIFGSLNANGTVVLANTHGFYFGPNSFINVSGNFVATTAPLPPDMGPGASWEFTGAPPQASIVNYGQISAGQGHSLFLIAEKVDNHGDLIAPGGSVGLYAGQDVLVTERADGRGLSATVKLPAGSVDNAGHISVDAGTIALNAQVVNQDGILQADSVREQNGTIELVAGGQLNLGPNSQILARGDDTTPGSPGGSVTLKSGNGFFDSVGSQIITSGGAQAGNGGNVEVSAPNILSLVSKMDASAQTGFTGGELLLDPANITLTTSPASTGSAGNGTVAAGSGSGTLSLNVNTAFANMSFSQIDLQATANITLTTGTSWNLSQSTGGQTGLLTLQAGGNIIFNNNAKITDANNWSVNLQAGVNFTTGTVQPGVGSIYLNGSSAGTLNGTVQTSAGNITMTAGQDILVGTGGIRTVGGGSITLQAVSDNINAGTGNGGYAFSIFGYSPSASPGGIATVAGGNVTLQAGNKIISQPAVPSGQPPGASGAYGSQPGNVTLIAGNQILGNYTLANGVGTVLAGVQVQNGQPPQSLDPGASVGSSTRPVSFSLINGSWNVWAANDIYIAEVRNPDGTFNNNAQTVPAGEFSGNVNNSTVPVRTPFLFDYAPNAAANLWAGNGITLTGANLPRVLGYNQDMPPIYPPILTLTAGAGGITINNPVVLYPSSQGALQITTTAGGDLAGAYLQGTLTGITMSDSGLPGFATFSQGHATTPLHVNDPNGVVVDISGDIDSFGLTVPTFAEITVAGSTYNFGFQGQNLSHSQTTSITVAGDITYRGDLTSVPLATPLPKALFSAAQSGDGEIAGKLHYDASTGTLTFAGQMSASELAFLLNPFEFVLSQSGKPILGANGQPLTKPLTLTAGQQAAIQQLYTASQTATLGDQGLAVAGPGHFVVSAKGIDLGISGGIQVLAPDSALAAISPYAASLTINTTGNLEMTSSKIADEGLLGGLQLNVGGRLDVGGEFTTFGDPNAAKGIFTTGGGGISIAATGDVNVDGSRIATYDGGDINIRSATGNVNAGAGGVGYVTMVGQELNSHTGQLVDIPATVAGSGILATTLPHSHGVLGDITIETPKGSINASAGGIIQIALNGASYANHSITLDAGQDINSSGSGIIGADLNLNAGGDIIGILFSRGNINVRSAANVKVTAFALGDVAINAGGDVAGTVIANGTADVSGQSITASLISESVSASGDAASATLGVPQSNVAKQDAKVAEDASTAAAKTDENASDDDKKKKDRTITLAQKAGRVTVITPGRNNPTHP
ncbi:MAG: filamentous hemagglutinin N-terminal domain-containing protein [Tepidisphaeraceae bacterium]|jgi:filamentous hemagglutinin family protein